VNIHVALFRNTEQNLSIGSEFFVGAFTALCVTGVFAFAGFAWPTHKLIWPSFYHLKHQDFLEKVYHILGVKYFRTLLLIAFWGKEKNKRRFFSGKKSGISNLEFQTKQAEFGHLLPFILLSFDVVLFVILNFYYAAALLFVINLIGNFYPILLQRHTRLKLLRLKKHLI
jgi:hypothetical protein